MANILIFNLILLAVVLETDLGRRKISIFRIARPFVTAAIIVPFFFSGVALTGWGLTLELGGLLAGVLLGVTAITLMKVEYDPTANRSYSKAGWSYVLLWVGITGARILFSYGAEHLFPRQLGTFMYVHHVSAGALGDAFIFLSLAMYLSRSGILWVKVRRVRRGAVQDSSLQGRETDYQPS